ncbi:cyclopropane-fatty-acyl-phospholipid synthase [Bradyrhizobium sacchari]|uniref:Cyclopropane-fatty-acyl-phospholipid synthase n=1 Tax=Bradyrhizobium sacchari TaxID=1399419 RepID=A0A560JZC0_9BRAD|nr:class I SAM-dependent methyltransferase [Bradyrhizobium sacchari]OPY99520.1 cyclopropane-fatty-acyl-phospholipid synthase [Bradyrhizobium sacchari]TWB62627.1 cyclopropane-fatty-acyl-phospholipid synthase [Bradyrhizobium sacchari]TWB76443.1 cyclopropane-fatty-acyl-phospholipid synthase [Bradyrhizobium sacchari]
MSVVSAIIGTAERVPLPDVVIRAAIQRLCSRTAARLAAHDAADDAAIAGRMLLRPIAGDAGHEELPASFVAKVLGPNRKSSCCFYKTDVTTLQEAEEEALRQTVEHAGLADGQAILELGCRWGSLSLWMARQFPNATVTAVSNSQAQRGFIEEAARQRRLSNLRVVTADMNAFAPERQFDRIVAVETFERVMNWRKLMTRLRSWLAPEGRFFMHIATHRSGSHLFDRADREDWIAQHVFTGGLMASHHLVRQFDDIFSVEKEWCWSGTHYQRTANDWLANLDTHRETIEAALREIYGDDAGLWMRRRRWFCLATSGLFGHADGTEWGVSRYRMKTAD